MENNLTNNPNEDYTELPNVSDKTTDGSLEKIMPTVKTKLKQKMIIVTAFLIIGFILTTIIALNNLKDTPEKKAEMVIEDIKRQLDVDVINLLNVYTLEEEDKFTVYVEFSDTSGYGWGSEDCAVGEFYDNELENVWIESEVEPYSDGDLSIQVIKYWITVNGGYEKLNLNEFK